MRLRCSPGGRCLLLRLGVPGGRCLLLRQTPEVLWVLHTNQTRWIFSLDPLSRCCSRLFAAHASLHSQEVKGENYWRLDRPQELNEETGLIQEQTKLETLKITRTRTSPFLPFEDDLLKLHLTFKVRSKLQMNKWMSLTLVLDILFLLCERSLFHIELLH